MASNEKASSGYTNFDAILKRGSVTEPRNFRPVPQVTEKANRKETNMSLNGAVAANEYKGLVASEPRRKPNRRKKTGSNEESGLSSDGSASQSRKRTPMTMPRTKITSATPLEQKIALKRLKQRLNFDDQQKDANEPPTYLNEEAENDEESLENSNLASENGESDNVSEVDTVKIDDRLDQVRDYIKQATGMYLSLSMDMSNKDPKKAEQLTKLGKLIQQLRVQEKGYIDLLQKTKIQQTAQRNQFSELPPSRQPVQDVDLSDVAAQQKELERLREQQALLKKIVDQQKELQQLKNRQSTLLAMQENAEQLIQEHRNLQVMKSEAPDNVPSPTGNTPQENELISASEASETSSNNATDSEDTDTENIQRRIQLEQKLESLNEKKQQMDELMKTLKRLKEAQAVESKKKSVLNEDDLSEVASEVLAASEFDEQDIQSEPKNIRQEISSLDEVRQKLQELKSIVNSYEAGGLQAQTQSLPNQSKDNRLHAQSIQQEQQNKGNTITGAGGARLRVQSNVNNQNVLMRDLQSLQSNIEELMDNRHRPIPQGIQRNQIDVTRNPSLKKKNTNQEKRQFRNPSTDNYTDQLRQLKYARKQVNGDAGRGSSYSKPINRERPLSDITTSDKDSDLESNSNSTLQWQDDPEFQNKVQKLKMAKEKLHHLQELVKVVQQGGGPNLPLDDLEDLTLTFSDDLIGSEYGESEEEEADEGDESDDEDEEEEDIDDEENFRRDGVESTGEQSDISKSTTTDVNGNFASENGLSDNERRYQGLLRKQRLELNYLLKERERLLEAQRKLSDLAGQASGEEAATTGYSSKKKQNSKQKEFPKLTKAELSKQGKLKKESKQNTMRRLFPKLEEEFYGSEHEIYPPEQAPSHFKQNIAAHLSNPMAVSEIRRQRDLFEEKKKQKFVEKQRRKKLNQNDENQSDDRATYVINSDIDEGVGVSMYSADVTTAATWGGSTEQSSDEDDSAVGDDEDENAVDDEYGSHFDQVEEEEEEGEGVAGNVPSLFKVKKFDEEPTSKKKSRGIGSVSWSLDVSPPRSRKRPRQGNLTPAHKLIQDNNNRRKQRPREQEQQQLPVRKPALKPFEPGKVKQGNSDEVQSQLATICSSLLRNEQTLLQMLQNQMAGSSRKDATNNQPVQSGVNNSVMAEVQDFFNSSNYNESYQQTLNALRNSYERIEQHQLDMEYLRQQFERLNQAQPTNQTPFGGGGGGGTANASDFRSPWPNPPSLHFSSFGGVSNSNAQAESSKQIFQKETQTETSLFDEPFKPSIQQYTLFGEAPESTGNDQGFDIDTLNEPTSPGIVGDRSFTHQEREEVDVEELFPYRLKISEYNPLSYQGNFANTMTGNTMTVSKMSMNKKNADSKSNDGNESQSIWPSFFKMADNEKTTNENEGTPKPLTSTNSEGIPKAPDNQQGGATATDTTDGNSLFDALRDSIYSEVATLIAMNESRPHYLIELFRELQLLNSDYLRQRALYALQELVTRYLTDETTASNVSPSKGTAFTKEKLTGRPWVASGSEQTPSDLASVVTTTDDEGDADVLQTLKEQMQNNGMYDYAELAESHSDANISTPGSHHDNPFESEDLGNTVINLEDAFHKSRSEQPRVYVGSNSVSQSTPQQQLMYETIRRRININMDNASTSSAGDVTSEASSDLQQPSLDTQKLDQQIKAVMMDLMPFLNENIDKTCDEEFLDKVRNLIVEFAKEKEPGSEQEQFGRFFHTQLDSILRDSLIKFNSRKLKECGEDILIDVSEILFNELAFFRLMQDLDRPGYGVAAGGFQSQPQDGGQSKMPFVNRSTMYDDSSAAESTDVAPEKNEETEEEENETEDDDDDLVPVSKPSNSSGASGSSSNAFVMVESVTDDDDDTESARQFVKVELSVSETRPVRSSGSGEEDQNEEEPASFLTVATPPSSINTYSQSGNSNTAADAETVVEDDRDEGDRDQQEDERSEHERGAVVLENEDNDGDEENIENETEDQRDLAEPESNLALAEPESSLALPEQEATEGDQNDQAESAQQLHETEEDTEDDLPEADMVSEDSSAAEIVLAHIEGVQELAGDPIALSPPSNN